MKERMTQSDSCSHGGKEEKNSVLADCAISLVERIRDEGNVTSLYSIILCQQALTRLEALKKSLDSDEKESFEV